MPHLDVFDPPLCCPAGVCGPRVDPVLPRFAATTVQQEAHFPAETGGRP
jgi:hypothetical protein